MSKQALVEEITRCLTFIVFWIYFFLMVAITPGRFKLPPSAPLQPAAAAAGSAQ